MAALVVSGGPRSPAISSDPGLCRLRPKYQNPAEKSDRVFVFQHSLGLLPNADSSSARLCTRFFDDLLTKGKPCRAPMF
jgi:hypothetical protein